MSSGDIVERLRRDPPPKGPIRILCDEIGFEFDLRLERVEVLAAFVAELVDEVAFRRDVTTRSAQFTGVFPSADSATVLVLARNMLAQPDISSLIAAAAEVHDAAHELNPDEKIPTDHLIDMLSSCASVIRFGLEDPCHSRHAASAADHIWRQVYGISLFDSHTPAWSKEWARSKLLKAVIRLLPLPPGDQG